tara:strand:+ start:10931 stop:13132 length:2202 start_codon:yes stop_codon:yes gene_type:complete
MPAYVSPGVYVIEKDWSDYTPSLNATSVGILGFASQGPVGKATLVTTQDNLVETFGRPDDASGGYGLIGAYHVSERTNTVMFTRVATTAANVAHAAVKLGTCPYVTVSGLSVTPLPTAAYTFCVAVSAGDGTAVRGYEDPMYFQVTTDAVSSNAGGPAGAVQQAVDLATTPSSPVQFVSDTSAGDAGTFIGTYAGSGAVMGVIFWSATTDFPVVPPGTPVSGLPALGLVASDTCPLLTSNNGTGSVSSLSGIAYASGVSMQVAATSGGTYMTRTLYPGGGYNYSSYVDTYGPKTKGLQTVISSRQGANNFFALNRAGGTEESAEVNLTQNTSGTSLNPEKIINNTSDDSNKSSEYILGEFALDTTGFTDVVWTLPTVFSGYLGTAATVSIVNNASVTGDVDPATTKYWKMVDGTYNFVSGLNGDLTGSMAISDDEVKAAFIGNGADQNGMYSYLAEDVDISLMAMPGVTEQNIVNAAVTLGEQSQEWLVVTNPPYGVASPQTAISWSNGTAEGRTTALNSSYACIYWPWVQVFNPFTKVDEYLSPDIFALRQMAFTDANFDSWIAPAGLTRGRLTKPVDVEMVLTQGDRDAMYGAGNCVNPIQKFLTDGIVIWGQRTAQRQPTALDRVNVRRLMIVIRKMLLASTRQFVFEPNDAATWSRVVNAVDPMLKDIKSRRGITDFNVICDATTNTPIRIDRSELWCKVIIQPTKAAEVIVFELNLTSATLGTQLPSA